MFERLMMGAAALAHERAAARRAELAAGIGKAAPEGVAVAVEGEAVTLSGRGLARRFMLEPGLRWLVAENRDGR